MKPIYATNGEWVALVERGYLYDVSGEWIGWHEGRSVYTRDGQYAGYFSDDQRVLRPRVREHHPLHIIPPPPPPIHPPQRVPLPPLFAELPWNLIDVFDEEPEVFKNISDLKPDWEGES